MGWDNLRWRTGETDAGTDFTIIWVECDRGHENAETFSWYPGADTREQAAEEFMTEFRAGVE